MKRDPSDFRNANQEKQLQREVFVGHLIQATHLTRPLKSGRGKLVNCDVLDLAGVEAPMFSLLLDKGLVGQNGKFIGVDRDPEVIKSCRLKYGDREDAYWVNGELMELLKADHPCLENVRALNFDSLVGWSGAELESYLACIAEFIARQQKRHGEQFLLGINVAARSVAPNPDTYVKLVESYWPQANVRRSSYRYNSTLTSEGGKGVDMVYTPIRLGFPGMDDDTNQIRVQLEALQSTRGRGASHHKDSSEAVNRWRLFLLRTESLSAVNRLCADLEVQETMATALFTDWQEGEADTRRLAGGKRLDATRAKIKEYIAKLDDGQKITVASVAGAVGVTSYAHYLTISEELKRAGFSLKANRSGALGLGRRPQWVKASEDGEKVQADITECSEVDLAEASPKLSAKHKREVALATARQLRAEGKIVSLTRMAETISGGKPSKSELSTWACAQVANFLEEAGWSRKGSVFFLTPTPSSAAPEDSTSGSKPTAIELLDITPLDSAASLTPASSELQPLDVLTSAARLIGEYRKIPLTEVELRTLLHMMNGS